MFCFRCFFFFQNLFFLCIYNLFLTPISLRRLSSVARTSVSVLATGSLLQTVARRYFFALWPGWETEGRNLPHSLAHGLLPAQAYRRHSQEMRPCTAARMRNMNLESHSWPYFCGSRTLFQSLVCVCVRVCVSTTSPSFPLCLMFHCSLGRLSSHCLSIYFK